MMRRAREGWMAAAACALIVCASVAWAAPPYYAKKATWQETIQSAREALVRYEAEQAAAANESDATAGVTLGPWHMAGPFVPATGNGFAYAFPPEKGIDLTKPMGKLRWQAAAQFADGIVHTLSAPSNGSTYLYRTVAASQPKTITGYFGSDDGMKAWLNGQEILSRDVPRGPAPNQDTAKLSLKQGENHLLLKIYNRSGGHGFYFSITGKARQADPRTQARDALWDLVARDFTDVESRRQMAWEKNDGIWAQDWKPGDAKALADRYVRATPLPRLATQAREAAKGLKDASGLAPVRRLYYQACGVQETMARASGLNFQALELAIADLTDTFGSKYPKGKAYLARLGALQKQVEEAQAAAGKGDAAATDQLLAVSKALVDLQREALLANPLLDFDRLLVIKRGENRLGLPQNWTGNTDIPGNGYDCEIALLSMKDPGGPMKTLYRPEKGEFVGDIDLHFDADRLLFSMPGTHGRWQVWEIRADGTGLRQVTKGEHRDVDSYDGCYLPDGRIICCSTAGYQGVPCVGGGSPVGNLFIMNADGAEVRQLTFDQDHSWCPTVLPSGRIIYTRWEYSDSPHYFTRLLFEMNPDGTAQFEHYGSNSYWPNSMFYARPVPGHPTQIATIVSGHHGVPRMGELIILDPARGKHEADGVVQRIPGYGKKVEPIIRDGLVDGSWPKFLHPWPLSEKYYLVSCKPDAKSRWGLYLVDVFDNMLLLREEPGYALFEPVPQRKTPKPPVIPDRIDLRRKDATVYLVDVYRGPGLRGVPRGTVKRLRVYSHHYGYRGMGGHINIGIDGPWDAKRILGTVPVYEDGSAMFRVPANTPIVVQPIDAEGKALQLMRSWYTAMPGEFASCVGCHEPQSERPPVGQTLATSRKPSDIDPWYGPPRPFSFEREVQRPVLQKYCVSCHNGEPRQDGKKIPDFRAREVVKDYRGGFTPAYEALHPYVRRPGPESDYHMLSPMEYDADTSELVQMLKKGHHGVKLEAEAWDRLYTWVDLNVPCHGTWSEHRKISGTGRERRLELARQYADVDVDPEAYPVADVKPVAPVKPAPMPEAVARPVSCPGWPFDAAEAKRRQAVGGPPAQTIDVGDGVKLELVRVPAGEFVMGDPNGFADERPAARVTVAKAYWMGRFEITNAQYAAFDSRHDSGYISWYNKDQNRRGEVANGEKQPVIRVSWQEATAFCAWLSKKTGHKFTLPTEAQWEYACRAGTVTAMNYGPVDADFGKFANFADQRLNNLTRGDSPPWIPTIDSVNDGDIVTGNYDRRQPNAWGLNDMHGNVCEWTRSVFKPYPYRDNDGRNAETPDGSKVVRGGSFYDRPQRGRSALRLAYPSWQRVYNVGFRVVTEDDVPKQIAAAGAE